MYQEILYEIVIFDHILGEGGWYMNIYDRRLLRPERSSAARRCAYFLIIYFVTMSLHDKNWYFCDQNVDFWPILPFLKSVPKLNKNENVKKSWRCHFKRSHQITN